MFKGFSKHVQMNKSTDNTPMSLNTGKDSLDSNKQETTSHILFEGKFLDQMAVEDGDVNDDANGDRYGNGELLTRNPFYFFEGKDSLLLIPALIANAACAVTDIGSTILINKLFTYLTNFQLGKYSSPVDFVGDITLPSFGILLISLGSTITGWIETSLFTYLGERQQVRCRKRLYESLLYRDLKWFENNKNLDGDLIQLNRSIEEFRSSISEYLSILFKTLFSIISLLAISLYYSWRLTLLIFSVIPIIIITMIIFGNKIDFWAKQEDDSTANAISLLDWNLSSFIWVKIIHSKNLEIGKFITILDNSELTFRKFSIYANLVSSIMKTLALLLFVQSFWFGSYLVRHTRGSGSDIISCFYSCLKLAMTISSLSIIAVIFQKANTSFKKVVKFMMSFEEIEKFNAELIIPKRNLNGDIQLENISFTYPASGMLNLRNLCLKIEPFKTTFIVGKSGSGKSTIASLILKLYNYDHGDILVDGYNLKDLDKSWLRNQITLVEQFPKIFNDTLKNNILLGSPYQDIDSCEVKEAIEFFNFNEVLNFLPDSYQTYIGRTNDRRNKLVQLSGGQEQKLNLIKAKLKDSPILILDESISALDIEQRKLFMKKIADWRQGKTTIIITHELAHINNKDAVYLIDSGEIAEYGMKQELVGLEGRFANLQNHATLQEQNEGEKRESKSLSIELENLDGSDLESSLQNSPFANTNSEKNEQPLINIRAPIWIAYKILTRNIPLKYKLLYILGLFVTLGNAILSPVFSYCFAKLINGLIPQASGTLITTYDLLKWSMIATSAALLIGITDLISQTILEFVAGRLCKILQKHSLAKLLEQNVQFFEYLDSNEVSTLLMNDMRDFRKIFSSNLSRLISSIAISVVCIIWTLTIGWKYALVGFSLSPLFAIFSYIGTKVMQKTEFSYKESIGAAESVVHETRVNIKTITCNNLQAEMTDKFNLKLSVVLDNALKRSISIGFSINFVFLLVGIAQSIMLYYGLKLVSMDGYSLIKMMQIVMMILMSVQFLSELMSSAPGLYRGLRVALKINQLLNIENNCNSGYLTPSFVPFKTNSAIRFQNVNFKYPGSFAQVLRDVTFTIPVGEFTSIVGDSGSGKSTIISLILRLQDAPPDSVHIDGYDITTIKQDHLMAAFGVVSQKAYFINGTVRENLLYGNPRAESLLTDTELVSLLNDLKVNVHLDTVLCNSSNNIMVSGGQGQRIALARAILRKPSILLLDEFTASLDVYTTKQVLDYIKRLGITIVCVTHQQLVMNYSDNIIRIKDGKIV